jgi:hypothetical protein
MPMWLWIVIGAGLWLGLSVVLGMGLARLIGTFERRASESHEPEEWAVRPPTRSSGDTAEQRESEEREDVEQAPRRRGH